jgi:hypothetical protein
VERSDPHVNRNVRKCKIQKSTVSIGISDIIDLIHVASQPSRSPIRSFFRTDEWKILNIRRPSNLRQDKIAKNKNYIKITLACVLKWATIHRQASQINCWNKLFKMESIFKMTNLRLSIRASEPCIFTIFKRYRRLYKKQFHLNCKPIKLSK